LDGVKGNPTTLVSGGSPVAITVDGTSAYWLKEAGAGNTLMKVPLGGGEPITLASGGITGPIAVDDTSVYFFGAEAGSRLGERNVLKLTPK
jgi:hypothetical protein